MRKTNATLSSNTMDLIRLRRIKNKTELAKLTGTHHKTIYDIHDNRGNPTLATLDLVAGKLHIPTWFLIQDIFDIQNTDIKQILNMLNKIAEFDPIELAELTDTIEKITKYKKVRETLAAYEPENPLIKDHT